MFCPQCGSTHQVMVGNICKICFLKDFKLISIPQDIGITLCAHCHSQSKEGKWKDLGLSEEEIIYQALEEAIGVDDIVSDINIELEILQMRGSIAECFISTRGNVMGEDIEQEFHSNVRLNKSVCPDCSKYNSGYYEAVIQLRADKRPLSKAEIKTADKIIKETLNRMWVKSRMAYLAQRVEMKEGIDYYIGSQKAARKVISALRDVFGGVMKESPRLISQDKSTGKGLYRTWISLRLPEFQKKDFIKYDGHTGQVKSMNSKKIIAKDLETGQSIRALWKDYEQIKSSAKFSDIQISTITSKSPTEIQILHPETFQPVDLHIQDHMVDLEIGKEVSVIQIDGRIYILPDE